MFAMLALPVALALSGCGNKGEQVPAQAALDTYVGKVQGANYYVAIISDGAQVSGFTTDGKLSGKWFSTADLNDDKADLVARDGSPLGQVSISDGVASGQLNVALGDKPYRAELATGDAGLFTTAAKRGKDSYEAGWIVLPDGSEKGTYDTFVNGDFSTHPAPPLKPTVRIPGWGSAAPHEQVSQFLELNTQAP
jgi:hypothetical protein